MVRTKTQDDPFTPTEEISLTEITTPTTTPTFRALKLASEVQAALEQRYAGPTKEIQGFTYIPWNESTKEANRVFGYFGWSSSVLSVDYVDIEIEVNTGTWKDKNFEMKNFKGFKSIVRVSIQVIDDYSGTLITTHHDGVGYGTIQAQGLKDPMDTACKAAKSDGISTAIKHYGDAFGLYLYDKEDQTPQPTTTTTSTTTPRTYSTGQAVSSNGARVLSEKQVAVLLKRCGGYGMTQDVIDSTDFPTLKAVLDDLFSDVHPRQAMINHGLTTTQSGTRDNLPIPVGSR